MTSPKDLFLTKDDLRGKLGETVNADWFQECVCFTVAQMHHDQAMSADEMRGVKMFLHTFREMHQKYELEQVPLSPGLKQVAQLKR